MLLCYILYIVRELLSDLSSALPLITLVTHCVLPCAVLWSAVFYDAVNLRVVLERDMYKCVVICITNIFTFLCYTACYALFIFILFSGVSSHVRV